MKTNLLPLHRIRPSLPPGFQTLLVDTLLPVTLLLGSAAGLLWALRIAHWLEAALLALLVAGLVLVRARWQARLAQIQESYEQTLKSLAAVLEFRDGNSEEHCERVAELCATLAQGFGLNETQIRAVRWGAYLHDIGKIYIPETILRKKGPLNDEEWAMMKKHPLYARQVLARVPFFERAVTIPYSHHERWDGSGYPQGLRGENIPLEARLFAVVDVWDALTSERTYRRAMSRAEALDYIERQSGAQFDPLVVEHFCQVMATAMATSMADEIK